MFVSRSDVDRWLARLGAFDCGPSLQFVATRASRARRRAEQALCPLVFVVRSAANVFAISALAADPISSTPGRHTDISVACGLGDLQACCFHVRRGGRQRATIRRNAMCTITRSTGMSMCGKRRQYCQRTTIGDSAALRKTRAGSALSVETTHTSEIEVVRRGTPYRTWRSSSHST